MLVCLDIKLAQMGLVMNPQYVVLDFELAAHNAWTAARPGNPPQIRGCFFHFSQCLWRKLQNLQLQQLYNNDVEFRLWAKSMLALPLLPTYEVEVAFQHLSQTAPLDMAATIPEFLQYMETHWINDATATFRIPVWNHFATMGMSSLLFINIYCLELLYLLVYDPWLFSAKSA